MQINDNEYKKLIKKEVLLEIILSLDEFKLKDFLKGYFGEDWKGGRDLPL